MVVECADVYSIVSIVTRMKTCQCQVAFVQHVLTIDTKMNTFHSAHQMEK